MRSSVYYILHALVCYIFMLYNTLHNLLITIDYIITPLAGVQCTTYNTMFLLILLSPETKLMYTSKYRDSY